jgi:hypothetical protein
MGAQVISLIHIWLILGYESPTGKIGQLIPDGDEILFIMNQELDIKMLILVQNHLT